MASDSPPPVLRIPSLDGLRAAAVGFVLLGHTAHVLGMSSLVSITIVRGLADVGVQFFFVLSGFLITWLLVEEQRRCGRISLGSFYMRRSLRILPAAYVFIAVVAGFNLLGWVKLKEGDMVHALTFTVDFHQDRGWPLGNLWSLGVEEQFYIIWPAMLIWLGRRRAAWFALGVVLVDPVVRCLGWVYFPAVRAGIDEQFEMVCDGLATGCLLGLLGSRDGIAELARKIPAACFALSPAVLLVCMSLRDRAAFNLPFGSSLINASIGIIVLWCATHSESAVGRLLNSRSAVFGGVISYSLYLWQQIFLMRPPLLPGSVVVENLLFAVLAAVGSFYLIERPLQSLRRHFRMPALALSS